MPNNLPAKPEQEMLKELRNELLQKASACWDRDWFLEQAAQDAFIEWLSRKIAEARLEELDWAAQNYCGCEELKGIKCAICNRRAELEKQLEAS